MAILKVEHLNKSFGGLQATCDVNYEMQTGELSAIIGPNGAGKSTFLICRPVTIKRIPAAC